MPLIKGTLYLINSPDMANNMLNDPRSNIKVLGLDEFDKYLNYSNPNAIKSTCLLPPPEAVMAEIDGDRDKFVWQYKSYLGSETVQEFMDVILVLLYSGGNAVLFAPEISEDSIWINVLLEAIMELYGIRVGLSESMIFNYNIMYDDANSRRIYMLGYMDPYEFLTIYNAILDPEIVYKLYRDLMPFVNPPMTIEAHLEELRQQLKLRPELREAISIMK